jgi:hypothetical protein
LLTILSAPLAYLLVLVDDTVSLRLVVATSVIAEEPANSDVMDVGLVLSD